MNRFLKKEWQDTEIPEQIYRQARNRAWAAIQAEPDEPRVVHRVRIAYGLAAMLALILLVYVSISKRQIQHPDQQAARTATVGSRLSSAALHAGSSSVEIDARTRHALEGVKKSEPLALESGPSQKSLLAQDRPPRRFPAQESPLAYARGSESSNRSSASQKAEGPERVVLNFNLPTSGARMIWILDKNFHLDGGSE